MMQLLCSEAAAALLLLLQHLHKHLQQTRQGGVMWGTGTRQT